MNGGNNDCPVGQIRRARYLNGSDVFEASQLRFSCNLLFIPLEVKQFTVCWPLESHFAESQAHAWPWLHRISQNDTLLLKCGGHLPAACTPGAEGTFSTQAADCPLALALSAASASEGRRACEAASSSSEALHWPVCQAVAWCLDGIRHRHHMQSRYAPAHNSCHI